MTLTYNSSEYDSIYGDVVVIDSIPFTRRAIDEKYYDLCSIYPFTYQKIADPIRILSSIESKEDCISLTVVTNPLTPPLTLKDEQWQSVWFTSCRPYKTHYIVNLSKSSRKDYSSNHSTNLKRFYKKGNAGIVEVVPQQDITPKLLATCYETYLQLAAKHSISTSAASWFDEEQFNKQFFVSNSVLIIARDSLDFGGWALFHRRENNMYFHLSATSPHGYKISSSYAILDTAIGLFKQLGYNYFLLGSGAGVDSDPKLEYFKSGWGTFTEKNYIYGKVNNPIVYNRLSRGKDSTFFPLYRS